MQDDAPDEIKNNRWDAISNTSGIDAKQLHLVDDTDKDVRYNQVFPDLIMSKQNPCTDFLNKLTCRSSRNTNTLEMLSSLKIR